MLSVLLMLLLAAYVYAHTLSAKLTVCSGCLPYENYRAQANDKDSILINQLFLTLSWQNGSLYIKSFKGEL